MVLIHIRVPTLIPIASAPDTPPPTARFNDLSRISFVVSASGFGVELGPELAVEDMMNGDAAGESNRGGGGGGRGEGRKKGMKKEWRKERVCLFPSRE